MERGFHIQLGLYSLLFLLGSATAGFAFEVLYPPDRTAIVRSNYLIVQVGAEEAEAIEIKMDGESSGLIDLAPYRGVFGDFFKMQASWDTGENRFSVVLYKDGKEVQSKEAAIYFLSDPLDSSPPDFEPYIFHLPETEKLCASCHNMKPSFEQMTDMDPSMNPCVICHKTMFNEEWIHGPAGAFQCGVCHEANAGGGSKYAIVQSDFDICMVCHDDKGREFDQNAFVHGPVGAGMCTLCHDPHASSSIFQMQKPINDLCKTCHEGFNTLHVLRAPSGNPHPLENRPDPARPGRELVCSSCHNPHGNNVRYFWRGNPPSKMMLCLRCHKK